MKVRNVVKKTPQGLLQTDGDLLFGLFELWLLIEDPDMNDSIGVPSNQMTTSALINSNAATRRNENRHQE